MAGAVDRRFQYFPLAEIRRGDTLLPQADARRPLGRIIVPPVERAPGRAWIPVSSGMAATSEDALGGPARQRRSRCVCRRAACVSASAAATRRSSC